MPLAGLAIGLILAGVFLTHQTSHVYNCDGRPGAALRITASGSGKQAKDAAPTAAVPVVAQAAGPKRDYVMAVSMGIKVEWLSIYVQSWKRFSPATKLVVFVDAATLEVRGRGTVLDDAVSRAAAAAAAAAAPAAAPKPYSQRRLLGASTTTPCRALAAAGPADGGALQGLWRGGGRV